MQSSILHPIDLPISQAWFHPHPPPASHSLAASSRALDHHHHHQYYPPYHSGYAYQSPSKVHSAPQPAWPQPHCSAPFVFGVPPQPVPDRLAVPELEPASSPSEPGSPMSTLAPPTPGLEFVHVVCNAPLLAPKPLPYRPPAFLDGFDLPDPDADLSRVPYSSSATARCKRKRSFESSVATDDAQPTPSGKRPKACPFMLCRGRHAFEATVLAWQSADWDAER
ncbi:hypothetical protein K488DRAFT_82778 [Vararia minispora EC-137]|uniref:Uncharacterized protein n=1 Tax=Vararia minispora EC-137 TaxID=1314806 RepID=A0ACB8QVP5_9AGAM|nr:hypothetical protein K488DRAFT_82778 [Vararia minispora EC-137]